MLLLAGATLYLITAQPVPIAGPVETSKSNYVITHSTSAAFGTFVTAAAGVVLLAKNFSRSSKQRSV